MGAQAYGREAARAGLHEKKSVHFFSKKSHSAENEPIPIFINGAELYHILIH